MLPEPVLAKVSDLPLAGPLPRHNSKHLKRLEEASGDYGRIVFLQLFEFTLFEVVKKVIVDERSGGIKGIQVAIDKITYASPLLLSPPSFIARSYVS